MKRKAPFFYVLFVLSTVCWTLLSPGDCPAQERDTELWAETLVTYRSAEGLYGFADLETGKFVVPPRYEEVLPFAEGLAPVMSDDKWGFIDYRGREVIPPQFEEVRPFHNSMAPVKLGGQWFVVDRRGAQVDVTEELVRKHSDGLIILDRELVDINAGYVRDFFPGEFRLRTRELPRDDTADQLARGLLFYNAGMRDYDERNYDDSRENFQKALNLLPEHSAGHRLAKLAIRRVSVILDSGVDIPPPGPPPTPVSDDVVDDEEM